MLRTVSAINTEKIQNVHRSDAPPPPPPDCCSTYVTFCYHLCSLPATQHCYGVNMHFVSVAPLSQCSAHFAGNHDGDAGAAMVAALPYLLSCCYASVPLSPLSLPSCHISMLRLFPYAVFLLRTFFFVVVMCQLPGAGNEINMCLTYFGRSQLYEIILGLAILCFMYTAFCLSMLQKHKK